MPYISPYDKPFFCLLCSAYDGHRHFERGTDSTYAVTCLSCHHVQQYPYQSYEKRSAFYAQQTQRLTRLPAMEREEKRRHVEADTTRRVSQVQDLIPCVQHRILDIGSGDGFFREALLNRNEHRMVDEVEHNTHIKQGREYQLITAFHVLEHLVHPVIMLRHWWKSVAPGGFLVIEVPNLDDYMMRRSAAYKRWMIQRAHIHYFTVRTLLSVIQQAISKSEGAIVLIQGVQRYSRANHKAWIRGKPEGEIACPGFMPTTLDETDWLDTVTKTFVCDTLYATIGKAPHGSDRNPHRSSSYPS